VHIIYVLHSTQRFITCYIKHQTAWSLTRTINLVLTVILSLTFSLTLNFPTASQHSWSRATTFTRSAAILMLRSHDMTKVSRLQPTRLRFYMLPNNLKSVWLNCQPLFKVCWAVNLMTLYCCLIKALCLPINNKGFWVLEIIWQLIPNPQAINRKSSTAERQLVMTARP